MGAAAGVSGQQAMIRAMHLLATDGEPTPSPFAGHPHRLNLGRDKEDSFPDFGTFWTQGKRNAGAWSQFRNKKGDLDLAQHNLWQHLARKRESPLLVACVKPNIPSASEMSRGGGQCLR